jgi:hypothetical protein
LYSYVKQTKAFSKGKGREGKTGPVWGVVSVGGGRIKERGGRRGNMVKILCTWG